MATTAKAAIPVPGARQRIRARRNYDATQAKIAVCAAAMTFFLVACLILAMGFVDFQIRLTRHQPDIRTADILDTVNAKADLKESFPAFLESSQDYREVVDVLQEQQANIGYRIERVCSRFEPRGGVANLRCQNFLQHVPFEGTVGQGDVAPVTEGGLPATGFKDIVVRTFAQKMQPFFNEGATEADFLRLFGHDIMFVATANQDLVTKILIEYAKRRSAYENQCFKIVQLLALTGHQGYRMPNCDVGGLEERTKSAAPPPKPGQRTPLRPLLRRRQRLRWRPRPPASRV